MVELIIFDLWQTLAYRKGDFRHKALRKMLSKTKIKMPIERFVKIFESAVQTKKWKSKFEAYKNLCKNMGLRTTRKNIALIMGIRDRAESKARLYSYTIPLLRQLREKGYKTGLLSNSSVFAIGHVRKKTKLLKYIDYTLFSFEAGVIKPDLRFFKKMLKMAKCRPNEAIMIGDKLKDDVRPPRELGMNAIHFRSYKQLKKGLESFGIFIS